MSSSSRSGGTAAAGGGAGGGAGAATAGSAVAPPAPSALPATQLLTRGKTGIKAFWGPTTENQKRIEVFPELTSDATELCRYSDDGRLVVVGPVEGGGVDVFESETGAKVTHIDGALNISAVAFSPLGTYLLTWHRRKGGDKEPNLLVYTAKDGKRIAAFAQADFDKDTWPNIMWTDQEQLAIRPVRSEVHVFKGDALGDGYISKLRDKGLSRATLAPGAAPYKVAAFIPSSKGAPAFVRIYEYPRFSSSEVVNQKSFYRTDKVDFTWAPDGSSLLVTAASEMSSDSYTGDSALYYLTCDGKISATVPLPNGGPVHCAVFAPNSKEFIAIAGKARPNARVFNTKCEPIFDFGSDAHNVAYFSPQGRFLLLAGFGNMSGGMNFYDYYKKKKLGSNENNCAVGCQWSPDGRYLMTSTVAPRLRVDNGFNIYKYNGVGPLAQHASDTLLEEVQWRPSKPDVFPDRPPSRRGRDEAKAASAGGGAGGGAAKRSAGVYRAPGSSGRVSAMMNAGRQSGAGRGKIATKPKVAQKSGPPGAKPPAQKLSKAERKRRAKAAAAAEAEAAEAMARAAAAAAEAKAQQARLHPEIMTPEKRAKRAKQIRKKLGQIEKLKAKPAGSLDADQRAKVASEADLRQELAAIEALG